MILSGNELFCYKKLYQLSHLHIINVELSKYLNLTVLALPVAFMDKSFSCYIQNFTNLRTC